MKPDLQSLSLYTLNALQTSEAGSARTSSVMSLLAASHSIEETVMRHAMDAIFFAGFQRFSAFLPQASRFEQLAARCKKVYVFGEADSATPAIPNLEYIPLQPGAPLTREWFIVFSHSRFSVALLTREIGSSTASIRESRFGRGRFYQGQVTLQDHIVQPAAQILHQALELPESSFLPAPIQPAHPVNTYLNQFAGYMDRAQSQLAALYNNLTERTTALERMEEIVRTMVSRRAWDDSLSLLEKPQETAPAPQRRHLTILFTDIQNFTPLFEHEDALALTQTLNRYFNLLATVIYERGGDIDKFLGDGLMAFFVSAQDAVGAAAEIQRRLSRFNNQQVAHLGLQFKTRIGIASGECVVTRIGSVSRREVTIIGDAVNLASRLQALAPANGLGMDESTYRAVNRPIAFTGRDVQVKGKGYQRMYSAEFEALKDLETPSSPAEEVGGKQAL